MSAQQSQPDDNMVPGQTYTFKLSLGNLITRPSASTITTDLNNNAPTFVSNSLQVSLEDNTATLHWLTNIYDVQFTYNGDGTDVISDVANSIIAAIKTGSNDDFTFTGAWADSAAAVGGSGSIADAVNSTLNNAIGTVNDSVNKLATGLGKTTAQTAQDLLTPIEIMVAIAVGLVVLLIFTSGKAGGVAAGPTGVKVGGR